MELKIIKIGNSKGVRIPKAILEKYKMKDSVILILKDDGLFLKPVDHPRKDWEAAFKQMHENGDDQLLFDDVFEDENPDEL